MTTSCKFYEKNISCKFGQYCYYKHGDKDNRVKCRDCWRRVPALSVICGLCDKKRDEKREEEYSTYRDEQEELKKEDCPVLHGLGVSNTVYCKTWDDVFRLRRDHLGETFNAMFVDWYTGAVLKPDKPLLSYGVKRIQSLFNIYPTIWDTVNNK